MGFTLRAEDMGHCSHHRASMKSNACRKHGPSASQWPICVHGQEQLGPDSLIANHSDIVRPSESPTQTQYFPHHAAFPKTQVPQSRSRCCCSSLGSLAETDWCQNCEYNEGSRSFSATDPIPIVFTVRHPCSQEIFPKNRERMPVEPASTSAFSDDRQPELRTRKTVPYCPQTS